MLKIGDKAPDFELPDQDGVRRTLSEFLEIRDYLLLYFYPKDDTTGCTLEARGVRDNIPKFKNLDCTVVGVSPDSVLSHNKFVDKYILNFIILSDESKETLEKYGVWQEKSMYGRKYMGVVRTSFLIDYQGKIVKIYEKVKPETHADIILADLAELRK